MTERQKWMVERELEELGDPALCTVLEKLEFELKQMAWEDDFQRGLRLARVLVILRVALERERSR